MAELDEILALMQDVDTSAFTQLSETPVFTGASGVKSPKNVAEIKKAEQIGSEEGKKAITQEQTDRIVGSKFLDKVLNEYVQGGMNIDDLQKALDIQKKYAESPTQAAATLKRIIVPLAEQYMKKNPAYDFPANLMYGTYRSMLPETARPEARSLNRFKKALANVLAKGLLGQVGTLTEKEQENPLEMLPTDWDTPQGRKTMHANFLELLNQYLPESEKARAKGL